MQVMQCHAGMSSDQLSTLLRLYHGYISSTLVQTKHIDTTTTSKLMGNYR